MSSRRHDNTTRSLRPWPLDGRALRLGRSAAPARLLDAGRLANDPQTGTGEWVVRTMNRHPQLRDDLIAATHPVVGVAEARRPRRPGSFALAYMAMVVEGQRDWKRFLARSSDELWRLCGFDERPRYSLTHLRFCELEAHEDAFARVAAKLVQAADRHTDGLVTRDVHVDGTESESHARLRHACGAGECARPRDRERAPRTATATSHDVAEERARLAETDDPVAGPLLGDAKRWRRNRVTGAIEVKIGRSPCWWTSSDPDAGVRVYARNGRRIKFWIGYLNIKATSHFVGAPIAVHDTSASVNENVSYPDTLARVMRATAGRPPRAVEGDRAYDTERIIETNTRQGIASVLDMRTTTPHTERADGRRVARCQHCGGPAHTTRFTRGVPTNPKPRVWFRCDSPQNDDCKREQSAYCEHDWRGLLPLTPRDHTYQALQQSHMAHERVHHLWRERYRVAGDDVHSRLLRRGLGAQRLRSQAALAVEWLRICHREGWYGSARRDRHRPAPQWDDAKGYVAIEQDRRRALGLDTCHGPVAVLRGYGPPEPVTYDEQRRGPAPRSHPPPLGL